LLVIMMFVICGCQKGESASRDSDSDESPKFIRVDEDEESANEESADEEMTKGVADETPASEEPAGEESAEETNKKAMKAYEEFLTEQRAVYVPGMYCEGSAVLDGREDNMAYIYDIFAMEIDKYKERNTDGKLQNFMYSYIDCGVDGVEELLLEMTGLGIYDMDDDSSSCYVIRYEGGQLYACYRAESWARSWTDIHTYGYVSSAGSGGAGTHSETGSIIDADGVEQSIYSCTGMHGWDASFVNPEAYDATLGTIQDHVMGIYVYTIDGVEYYSYEIDENYADECKEFVSLCEQQGTVFSTQEELDQLVEQRIASLGITERMLETSMPEWNDPKEDSEYGNYNYNMYLE